MSAVAVRRASASDPKDLEALAQLRFDWCTSGGETGGLEAFRGEFGEWWRAHETTHHAWIASTDDGAPIGMAWLGMLVRIPGPERFTRLSGFIQSVYVDPAHRDEGTGRALVDAAVAYARELGAGYLAVHPSERSDPLYRRVGFAETSGVLELALTEPRRP